MRARKVKEYEAKFLEWNKSKEFKFLDLVLRCIHTEDGKRFVEKIANSVNRPAGKK